MLYVAYGSIYLYTFLKVAYHYHDFTAHCLMQTQNFSFLKFIVYKWHHTFNFRLLDRFLHFFLFKNKKGEYTFVFMATKDVFLERKMIKFQFDVFALNLMLLYETFDVFEMPLAGNTGPTIPE